MAMQLCGRLWRQLSLGCATLWPAMETAANTSILLLRAELKRSVYGDGSLSVRASVVRCVLQVAHAEW